MFEIFILLIVKFVDSDGIKGHKDVIRNMLKRYFQRHSIFPIIPAKSEVIVVWSQTISMSLISWFKQIWNVN